MRQSLIIKTCPIVVLILCKAFSGHSQELEWVKLVGGDYADVSHSLTIDQYGNSYTTGFFSTTVDFDPSEGVHEITKVGGYFDCFVSKLNTNGEFVWAKAFQGLGDEEGIDVAVDKHSNVYIVGQLFYDKTDFDPGLDTFYLQPEESLFSGFLVKLDSMGDFLWAFQLGPGWLCHTNSVDVDDDGNVYVTGHFSDSIDLDPGPGVHMLTDPGYYQDPYICKYDGDGNFIWGKHLVGSDDESEPNVNISSSGFVHVSFNFTDSLEVNLGGESMVLTSNGHSDICVSTFDLNGQLVWAKQIGGGLVDYSHIMSSDMDGNVYVGGWFSGTVNFDPGPNIYSLSAIGETDLFLLKLDQDGNLVWCKQMGGGNEFKLANSLAVDFNNRVYMAGYFEGSVDFDPGNAEHILVSEENIRTFMVILRENGDFERAFSMAGDATHFYGNRIAIDHQNNLLCSGGLLGTADFDPGPAYYPLTGPWYEFYVTKLSLSFRPTGIDVSDSLPLTIHPNPSSDVFSFSVGVGSISSISICDTMGREVVAHGEGGSSATVSVGGIAPGVYFATVVTDRGRAVRRVVVQ